LHIHGGGFIGGIPEADADFCTHLTNETGAVVIAASYRLAPRYPFPAAIDDVDDVVEWILNNAGSELHVDNTLLTTSGYSAGGNLALATTQSGKEVQEPSKTAIKGCVVCYALVCCSTAVFRADKSRLT
jgi:acetyl esterase/lipase